MICPRCGSLKTVFIGLTLVKTERYKCLWCREYFVISDKDAFKEIIKDVVKDVTKDITSPTGIELTEVLKASYDGAAVHAGSAHAPANAQKNSDITKGEIENKLIGEISSHSHSGGSSPTSWGKYF